MGSLFEGVLLFGALNMAVELVVLAVFMPPRVKLRLLGNDRALAMFHVAVGVLTLWVHWGTVTGTGSAFVAFLASFPTLWIAKQVIFGYVQDGHYHRRILGYKVEELV